VVDPLIWADGGYANGVDTSLIGRYQRELGIRLEIVRCNDEDRPAR
jgi:hypothetical protein